MRNRPNPILRRLRLAAVMLLALGFAGCDDPQVYGSIGVSSGYSSWGGYGGSRVGGSITMGGRIM